MLSDTKVIDGKPQSCRISISTFSYFVGACVWLLSNKGLKCSVLSRKFLALFTMVTISCSKRVEKHVINTGKCWKCSGAFGLRNVGFVNTHTYAYKIATAWIQSIIIIVKTCVVIIMPTKNIKALLDKTW